MIQVTSGAFNAHERLPMRYTGEGEDVSPPLKWETTRQDVREFALIVDDPDAPTRKPFIHWVAYRIPGSVRLLPEGDASSATEGVNDFGRTGYGGPLPPRGHCTHHYYFRLYALDAPLELRAGASKDELLAAMQGHVIDEGHLIGTYERI